MHCSQCEKPASGNFCSSCGAPLQAKEETENLAATEETNWLTSHSIHQIVQHEKLRNLLEFYSSQSKKGMSGHEILAKTDKFLRPLTGGVPLEGVASVMVPLSIKLGIKTGKKRSFSLDFPVGAVMAATFCYLAWKHWPIIELEQCADGGIIQATVPSDLFAWDGVFVAGITGSSNQTNIDVGITIKGQIYDWGKSKRLLADFEKRLGELTPQILSNSPSALS